MHSYRQGRTSRPPPSREAEYKFIADTVNEICTDIKQYAQKYFNQKKINYSACSECLKQLLTHWKIEGDKLTFWKDFLEKNKQAGMQDGMKNKEGFRDLLAICERSKEFEIMIPQIRQKLVKCVKDHVYKYCLSFSEELGGVEARPVLDYEDAIRSYKKEIDSKISSVNADILRYGEMKSPFDKFVSEGEHIGALMEEICVQIVATAHTVKTWVSDDAAYPDKLSQEIMFNNSYFEKLQEDLAKIRKRASSLSRSLERRRRGEKKVEKEYTQYCREKKKLKNSLKTVNAKIEKLQFQIQVKEKVIEETKSSLASRKPISPRMEDDLHDKLDKDTKDCERLHERLAVMRRQKSRLERELKTVSDTTYELKVELVEKRHEDEEMEQSLDGMQIEAASFGERLKVIDQKTFVLKHVRLLKVSPETLRKLYRRRREYYQQVQLDEACRYVAQCIGGDWKKLYDRLPFEPTRDSERRHHDIELIDAIAARRDKTPEEQAFKCLQKWRDFSRRHADIGQLIRGLRRLNKLDLADKVETRFASEEVYG